MSENTLDKRIEKLEEKFDSHEKLFAEFQKEFSKFEGGNEQRQKNIEDKLETILEVQKDATKHDNAQSALVSDLNNEITNILKPMSASFTRYKQRVETLEKEIQDIKTEKRMLNRFWGVAVSVAIILSPVISQWLGNLFGINKFGN